MSLANIIRQRREELKMTQEDVASRVDISKPYLSNIETGKAKNPPSDGVLRALERALKFKKGELVRIAHLERTPKDVRDTYERLLAELLKMRSLLLAQQQDPAQIQARIDSVRAMLAEIGATGPDVQAGRAKPAAETPSLMPLSAGVVVPIINKVAAGYPHNFTDLDYPPSVADEYIRCPDVHDSQAFAARVSGDSMEPEYHEGDIVVFSPNTPARSGDDCFVRFAEDEGTTFKRVYQDSETTLRLQPLNSAYPAQSYPREKVTGLWPAVFRIQPIRRSE